MNDQQEGEEKTFLKKSFLLPLLHLPHLFQKTRERGKGILICGVDFCANVC